MRAGIWLACSFVVNVALAVALIFSLDKFSSLSTGLRPSGSRQVVPASNIPIRIVKPNVLDRTRLLSWADIESTDYAIFIRNLRAIGCPENTIRDIIVADVSQIFSRRLHELTATNDFEWWRTEPSPEFAEAARAPADELERERRTLLVQLLGATWDADLIALQPTAYPLGGPVLGTLPPETRKQVQDLALDVERRLMALVAEARNSETRADPATLARIRDEFRARLAQFLTPQQLEEYLLRYSITSIRLRDDLKDIEPTPDEFRAAYRRLDALDRELDRLDGSVADADVTRRAELQRQREAAIQTALGAERYDELLAAHDPEYADARRLASSTGLSLDAALAFNDIRSLLNEQREAILADSRLTPEQRVVELLNAEREADAARAQLLGINLEPEPKLAEKSVNPQAAMRSHMASAGDSPLSVGFRYGVSVDTIMALNPDINWKQLSPGTPIRIPDKSNLPPRPPLPPGFGSGLRNQ